MYDTEKVLPIWHDNDLMFLCAHPKQLHFPTLVSIDILAVPVFITCCARLVPVVVVNIPMAVAGSLRSERGPR